MSRRGVKYYTFLAVLVSVNGQMEKLEKLRGRALLLIPFFFIMDTTDIDHCWMNTTSSGHCICLQPPLLDTPFLEVLISTSEWICKYRHPGWPYSTMRMCVMEMRSPIDFTCQQEDVVVDDKWELSFQCYCFVPNYAHNPPTPFKWHYPICVPVYRHRNADIYH